MFMGTIGSSCRSGPSEFLQKSLFTFLLRVYAVTTGQTDRLTENQEVQVFYAPVYAKQNQILLWWNSLITSTNYTAGLLNRNDTRPIHLMSRNFVNVNNRSLICTSQDNSEQNHACRERLFVRDSVFKDAKLIFLSRFSTTTPF